MKTYPALLLLLTLASCSASPTSVRALYTLRSVDGHLQTRDIAPDPKPREAITGDDYFQIKLE
ncbi:MAG: hypothetical protein RBU37_27940, partial [Myxococcota bacterium]|nr:hypothetical protein [Myxococcota bacterium]